VIPLRGDHQSVGDIMKNGILVDFKPDGTEVQIIGSGLDIIKAMELVLSSLDESNGSTALSDDILERLVLKRKQAKERNKKPSGLMELLIMIEALNAMKSGDRESFTSFYDRFMYEFENRTSNAAEERSNLKDHRSFEDEFHQHERIKAFSAKIAHMEEELKRAKKL